MFSGILIPLLAAAGGFFAGVIVAIYFERSRASVERANFEKSSKNLIEQLETTRARLHELTGEEAAQRATIARLEERNAASERLVEQMRTSMPETFKSLAGEVLEEKSRRFAEHNRVSLGQVLEPFRSRLEDFHKEVESARQQQVRGGAELSAQIRQLFDSNTRFSEQAYNLASVLRGSNKAQGAWGELILERILEAAGLRSGQEYDAQERYASENGRRGQPDVVIHLPGDRHLVIDSKVSLVHYEAHSIAENEADRLLAADGHSNSVRAHIRSLAEKNYQALYGLNSLDFVIMFLPIEPAFMLAVSRDDKLWEQAWQRNVLLVSPSTLLFVLRTVASLWRQEQQKRNVEEIARRGAELYNKLAGFVADFTDMGKRLEQAQASYASALSKLHSGPGNVIRQAEMLKTLGVKPTKQIPLGLAELAQQETLELEDQPELP
ncbi:MAG TPA: DNA recombination protein RmuC [Acidobacteriaceae bacterium]|nr:DNA recombination protein RmuC [Acidobacteriaceae bacterium]